MDVRERQQRVMVLSPVDLHSSLTMKELLLVKLRQVLTGRVEKSCFIVSVDEIVNHSCGQVLMDTYDGSVQVSVEFWVTAVVVRSHTPMVGRLELARFNYFVLKGSSSATNRDNLSILVREPLDIELAKHGLYLPVLSLGSGYDQLSRTIKVEATFKNLYGADQDPARVVLYRCTRPLTAVEAELLGAQLADARALTPLSAFARKMALLIHPYKEQLPGRDLLAYVEEELAFPLGKVFLARPPFLDFSLPCLIATSEVALVVGGPRMVQLEQSRGAVLLEMLIHYCTFHRFVEELGRVYADRFEEEDYAPLWAYFRNRKQPLPAKFPFK